MAKRIRVSQYCDLVAKLRPLAGFAKWFFDSGSRFKLMIWLIGVVLILQACFYWILKPAILIATPIVEFRNLAFWILVIGLWLFSGRSEREGPL